MARKKLDEKEFTKSPSKKKKFVAEVKKNPKLELFAFTPKQGEYISAIDKSATVITLGSAGTGKTFIPTIKAVQMLESNEISKIILTRPLVSVGKTAGLLPGTMDEKLEPWFRPFLDVIIESIGFGKYECHRKNGKIVFAPLEQMQGRSFKDAFIILDEAQNCTSFELKMFLTRLGENCKTVVDGDVRQKSLQEKKCGLAEVIAMIRLYSLPIPIVEFTLEDVVRSDQCAMWISAFESYEHGESHLPAFVQKRIAPGV